MNRRTLLTFGAAVSGVVALTLFIGWWQVDGPGAPEPVAQRPLPLTQMEFQMTNQDGATVGPASLIGNPSMVFFGFTYCPDVCPTTLSDISGWLDDLGDEVADLNVVFITVDPERDTVDAMADYISYFHPAIQGWSGTLDTTARAAAGFRARYEKVATEGGDYAMNHTASVFLFDAEGQFSGTIDYHEQREFAVPKIRRVLTMEEETS
ncbi:SCO1/2 family protein [Sulfitobacter noctilucicola]|jgi:protein SCO1/2|uniref:BsSco n=3 Tax=Roseobacteraceae TaxID=2854170 RepID=A0A0P1HGB8_9RHOB|nr:MULTISPECIES: SCO family protein [Rhodobacterales]KIN66047.1 SCO1/2 family protein [Sulfitobacter noctilucicola]MBB4175922.1 protein SCO1/2 [Sulfitobacter noctilucicola]WGI21896.1 SCO family protein [Amylibacter sp. IMCC11727]CUH63620.1 BsSco [Thalassovita autumnalis]CUH71785.1 BsSco [Thalassovita autumnalis]